MATYTTNLGLKKPAQSDKIRIADINNNMDTLDGAVGAIGERSIATQLGDVEGALAIVSVGNVHDAITSGQYVYIKNHDTLDDGLYVATTNISANGTLSSSNVTSDSAGGGLNALNSKLIPSNVSYSFTNYVTGSTNDTSIRKIGNILIVNIVFTANNSTTLSVATFSGISFMPIQYCLFREVNSTTTKRGYVNNNELTIVDAEANKQYIGVATFAIT